MKWVLLPKLAAETGYTEKALRRKVEEGVFVEGVHYRHAPDGTLQLCVEAYERWVEEGPREPAPDRGHTELYRHYDDEGTLLYVGISLSAVARLRQHRDTAPWFDRIARIDVEHYPTRAMAEAAERRAIADEQPLCNIRHSVRGRGGPCS